MKRQIFMLIIILFIILSIYFIFLSFKSKYRESKIIKPIPVVSAEEISIYNPKDNTLIHLNSGNRIFASLKNGKYLLCGEGEPLFKADSLGYHTGYNLFIINTETKEKIHLLGYEEPKIEKIQVWKTEKVIKNGGDIVSVKVHPDEKRVFYVDKNCALWEFNIENKENKKLTEDYKVLPRYISIDKNNNKLFYSIYGDREKEGIFQEGISIEVIDLKTYKREIFKEAEKHPDLIGYGAEYGVIGIDNENKFIFMELSLSAVMTELLNKGKNKSWSGLIISRLDKFEIIKEYPYPYKNEITDIRIGYPIADFIEINGFCYILGREQKEVYEGSSKKEYQNLLLAIFKGSELIEVKVLKEKLFLGFQAKFTFDGNIAYEENPDEWVIIDLNGKELFKLPKGVKPY